MRVYDEEGNYVHPAANGSRNACAHPTPPTLNNLLINHYFDGRNYKESSI